MSKRENQTKFDVIISGAGPVGLFLAGELALRKCSVLVLERAASAHSPIKQLPFGIRGLNAPSIEALDRRGLLVELEVHKSMKSPHQDSGKGTSRQVGHFAGIPLLEGNIDTSQWKNRLSSSTPMSLLSEIQELETVLSRRATSLGVEIWYGTTVAGFQQSADRVVVNAGDQTFISDWLVGCDGARSNIRKSGDFEFAGTEPEFTGYSLKIDLENGEALRPGRNMTSTGMYLQSQPGYLMLQNFDGGAFHDSKMPITLEHVQNILSLVSQTDAQISKLHFATTWTDRARQATSYRKGRVLLAGDAAHIHSPLGGQGLNLGLGDAMNLGWKLASVIHGSSQERLLDTYESERHPLGMQVLEWTRSQVAIMKTDPGARALNSIVRDLIGTRDGATYFAGRVWGVNTHYKLQGKHPLTGHSVPNFEFKDGSTVAEWMRDGHGLLIDFSGDSAIGDLAREVGERIRFVSQTAKEQLGLRTLVVRPDGIVICAVDSAAAELSELRDALSNC